MICSKTLKHVFGSGLREIEIVVVESEVCKELHDRKCVGFACNACLVVL